MTFPQIQNRPNQSDAQKIIYRSLVDPVWFCRKILNVKLEVWQRECMIAVADLDRARHGLSPIHNPELKRRFTIVSAHRTGKTFYICCLMLWFQFTRRGRVPLTAIKEATITRRTFPTMSEIIRGSSQLMRNIIHIDYKHAYFYGDKEHNIIGETATNPDALAGYHHRNLMFVVDEASSIPDPIFAVVSGALASYNSILVMIANPTRTEGFFYQSHRDIRTEKYYYRKAIKAHETTRISTEWIEEMRIRFGENSPIYKIRALGEFAESTENQLISLNWVNGTRLKDPYYSPDERPIKVFTCDVGAGGTDPSVVIEAHVYSDHVYLVKLHKFSFPIDTAVADTRHALIKIWVEAEGDATNGDYLVVDSIGVGDGVSSELAREKYPVIRYKGGGSSDNKDTWRNRRVQSYLCMRDALRDKNLKTGPDFCDDDDWLEYEAQMASIRSEPGTERYEDIETKKKMQLRGVKSPDMVDATSMIYATQSPVNGAGGIQVAEVLGEIENFDEEW